MKIKLEPHKKGKGGVFLPSAARREQIEKIVNKIVIDNELIPAFDLVKFLTERENFQIGLQPMEKNTMGVLLIDDNQFVSGTKTHKLIAINSELANEENFAKRRRFIIAHEYAHSVLHKKQGEVQYAHRDTDKRDKPIEKEADFFARCLLMPKMMITQFLNIDVVKNMNFDEKVLLISRLFAVTPKKAIERLIEVT